MKLRSLTQRQIFDAEAEHYGLLQRPNPPTEDQVKRAQFVDKTYIPKADEY